MFDGQFFSIDGGKVDEPDILLAESLQESIEIAMSAFPKSKLVSKSQKFATLEIKIGKSKPGRLLISARN